MMPPNELQATRAVFVGVSPTTTTLLMLCSLKPVSIALARQLLQFTRHHTRADQGCNVVTNGPSGVVVVVVVVVVVNTKIKLRLLISFRDFFNELTCVNDLFGVLLLVG